MRMQHSRRFFFVAWCLFPTAILGYPSIWETEGSYNHCFNYDIPEDDDATLVVVAIPGDVESDNLLYTQDFYIDKFVELGSDGGENFPKKFEVDYPENITQKIMESKSDSQNRRMGRIVFSSFRESRELIATTVLDFYKPYVLHEVVGLSMRKGFNDSPPLGGYRFCFKNPSGGVSTLIFDIVHWNDEEIDDKPEEKIIEKRHLSPLELSFKQSVDKARQIVDEMIYIERRSMKNMKQDEFYRSFVSNFSYLSIIVLIFTAWVQVMYLKRYFKKKKLL